MEFLGTDWVLALDGALASTSIDPDVSLVIEQTVTDHDEAVWHVVLVGGRVRVAPGPCPDADVRLRCDSRTAAAVARGDQSAQRAFLDGRIHLDGDVSALRAARPALDALHDAFASVRAVTNGLD